MNRSLLSLMVALQLVATAAAASPSPWALSLALPERPAAPDSTPDSIAALAPAHRSSVRTWCSVVGALAGATVGVIVMTGEPSPTVNFTEAVNEEIGRALAGIVLGVSVGIVLGHFVGRALDPAPSAPADTSAVR